MKYIISGTNRPNSRSLAVAKVIQEIYRQQGESTDIIDLCKVPLSLIDGSNYGNNNPPELDAVIDKVNNSDGLIVVCPEYNGSLPGALKYFIDHWKFPDSFEFRPVAFVGLGGRFGGLRPVEHLQQVFGYRNAFIYPERVFLIDVWSLMKDNQIEDEMVMSLLKQQAKGFSKFVEALKSQQLDANSILLQAQKD